MEPPHAVNSRLQHVKWGDARKRELLRPAPWALLVVVLGAVVCLLMLYVLFLYLWLLDA